jgi:hypothetical protein
MPFAQGEKVEAQIRNSFIDEGFEGVSAGRALVGSSLGLHH